jgi:hypothetical protein
MDTLSASLNNQRSCEWFTMQVMKIMKQTIFKYLKNVSI